MGSGGWLLDRDRFFKKAWVLKTWVALFSCQEKINSKVVTKLSYEDWKQNLWHENKMFILGNCDSHLKMLQRTSGISSCTRQ